MADHKRGVDPSVTRDAVEAISGAFGAFVNLGFGVITGVLETPARIAEARRETSQDTHPAPSNQRSKPQKDAQPIHAAPVEALMRFGAESGRMVSRVLGVEPDAQRRSQDAKAQW